MPKKTKSEGSKRPRREKRPPRTKRAKRRRSQPTANVRSKGTRVLEATLASLAHDIRTPLTGILALSELLETSGLGERERGWARTIKSTAEHLATLTSLIVDAVSVRHRRVVLRRTLFYPRRLIDDLAASLAARATAKGLQWEVSFASDLPVAVMGDALRLRGALENLIDNAVKFTNGGRVDFEVSSRKLPRARLCLDFTVSDSGIGLEPAEIKRLFRPFTQANEEIAARYGGAGLGLAFVKRIAKAMNGNLTAKSLPGRGSSFRLTVTVEQVADGDMPAVEGAVAGVPVERALKVLCVEGNPYGRVVLNTILTDLGYRPDFAVTGEAAIKALSVSRYDAVLIDIALPDISGFEAARRILSLPGEPVSVVGISGRGSAEEEARARAAGMVGYLRKPLSPGMLARALAEIASVQ
jgi:CheY-like chemotaxis protein